MIVAARHEPLGQSVAIKFLSPDSDYSQQSERFLREARAAAAIESPHVCRVFDCGTLPSGVPYMVMERLVGHDLARELKQRGPLPIGEAVDFVLEALEGIAEAHAVGIIHRDLKPSNLFLSQRPGRPRVVKVLDFGISKLTPVFEASVEDDLTHTEMMLGSPRYMSPEQVQNARGVDARTDLWSLGVILYQLLDGRSPFAGTTMGETLGKVLTHDAPPIRTRRPEVPDGLATVLDRCLQRDRDRRYRNVAELALALAPFGTGAAQGAVQRVTALLVGGQLGGALGSEDPAADARATIPMIGSSNAPVSEPREERTLGTVAAFTQSSLAEKRSRRWGYALGALLALAAGAAGLVALSGSEDDESAAPTAAARPESTAPASAIPLPVASVSAPSPEPEPAPPPSAPAESDTARVEISKPRAPERSKQSAPKRPSVQRSKPSADDILSESY